MAISCYLCREKLYAFAKCVEQQCRSMDCAVNLTNYWNNDGETGQDYFFKTIPLDEFACHADKIELFKNLLDDETVRQTGGQKSFFSDDFASFSDGLVGSM